MKKGLSLLLVFVMLLGMLPIPAFATEETEANPWSGRSAVFVGDSITAGTGTTKTYHQFLEEALGLGSVTAMGVPGSCVSAASDYSQSNQPLINRYQSIPSADLIVIFMGTNDYGHETPLGSLEDTQDGTFYGALNTIIPDLVAKHPSSKIVFVTPLHRYGFGTSKILETAFTYDSIPNGVGASLGDYVYALKTVCANNGVSVIDLYTECTLDPSGAEVRAAYMPDGLHPNAAGHEVIAGIMESHIRGYEPVEGEPIVQTELIHGNKFAAGNNQSCRASSRINYYLKAGTVITLKNADVMQWACTKTSDENSSSNLGYFPDSGWSDKETAVVAEDGWIGFTFKYRDETQSFDLTKPLSDYITIEEPHTHTYENGICTGCGATVSPYLQQLPEKIIGCTNLYDSLAPVKGYYTATKYDTSNGNVLSVVIPVEPGDRIAASSFGSVSENMGSVNGIRVTYLLGNEIVSSLSPGDVYSGYTTNGYITVPDGVDAVCVPWWKPSDSNWLTLSQSSKDFAVHIPKTVSAQAPTCTESGYTAGEICEICGVSLGDREVIPATGHSYSGDTCAVCGTVNLLAFLDGKYVSILGDSISTFNGYSNDAAVNTTIGGNGPRYDAGTADTKPGSYCLLESVDDTWWMHFANRSGMKLLVNNSWAGSQVFGGQTSDGRVIPAAYLDRCVNLHDNTLENNPDNTPINPDVIFVYLGINDYNFNRSKVGTGAVDYAGLVNSDGTYVTPETFGEAYGIMLHKMRNAYPDAQIFAMTLLPENLYSVDKTAWEQHNTYIRAAAEYYGIPVVDLAENCAITWENYSGYMIDKIHPTTAGMELISDCVEAELVAYYKENQTHTHTYENGICTGCGAEDPSAITESLSLRYDDHYDVTGKTVEIIDAGTPTSYKVGYGVAEGTLDDAVVILEGNYLIATGIGTATVRIDGIIYDITVTAAPISLILLIGQSNMRGSEGNANQSIVCPDGMVYATYGDDRGADNTAMTVNNATMFVPSALTGEYSSINVEGTTDCLSGYPVYSLTEAGAGKIGPDSGFAYEWVKQTGEKVWIVNAAHGGTSINVWQPGTTEYEQCQALFTACQETLRKEIAAGHFTLSHMGYFWCQGCSDRTQSAAWYVEKYLAMHEGFKTELAFDHDGNPETADKTFEFGGIIPVRVGNTATCYRDGVYNVSNPYAYHESFVDLRMNGPRVAQYWMINNPDLPDIWGVCNIGDDWVWMPDGTNGVATYFQTHYPNGTVDYTTQVAQTASWYTPTTPKAVHDSIHYNQIGYNEIGRESVRNALIMLGEIEAPDVETTVELLTWDGYTEATQVPASTTGNSATLVVPVVYPIWKSKDVTYELSEGLSWNYYDLLADTVETEGVLTTIGAQSSVNVTKPDPGSHFAGHLSQLPENVCCGLNLWSVLEHDEYYYASGTHWGIYSSGEVPSVTISVNPGDRIFATSFGKAGENGHTSSNGIRVTFFSAYGVAKTMTPAECYAEFSKNGGYLIAPEGAIAVNVAMWNNSSENELYILNRTHCYENGICTGCGDHIGPVITQQPADSETVLGERFCVTVEAEGENLKYQWYFRNAGSDKWYKSSVRDNTYDDVMTKARAGREICCVITDANGYSVTTETARLICVPRVELAITAQPVHGEAELGDAFCVTVEAQGDGLTYQWYFRNAGSEIWFKSGVRDNTYDDVMTKARAGREIYCVITDVCGNSVTTDTVKLMCIPRKLEITQEPADTTVIFGETFCAAVGAQGDGLRYQWYFRNAGSDKWYKSGVRDNTYDDVMTRARAGREVYCVITDMWGNSVTTATVKLMAVPKVELKLLGQTYESAALGERFCVRVDAQGDDLQYQWYFRNAGSEVWFKSGVRDNTYDDVMTKTRAGREVYCVITDAHGNRIVTDVVTLAPNP